MGTSSKAPTVLVVEDHAESREMLCGILQQGGLQAKGASDGVDAIALMQEQAPSLVLIRELLARGASVRAYDPVATHEAQRMLGDNPRISYAKSPMDALEGADALAIVTEWKAFWSPDFVRIAQALSAKVLFDGRNIYDPKTVEAAGIAYYGIGRGRSVSRPEFV